MMNDIQKRYKTSTLFENPVWALRTYGHYYFSNRILLAGKQATGITLEPLVEGLRSLIDLET